MADAVRGNNMFRPEDFDSFDLDVSFAAPRAVVPLLQAHFHIGSVVDLGCGPGVWLAAFAEAGVTDILGYDGYYIQPHQLAIPPERFRAADLTQPLELERHFDLACCLEVAEHLPSAQEEPLVDVLTAAAPVVLFSAGIPGQPGQGHINLKWQSHWAELFARRNYRAYDLIRPEIWGRDEIYWWYQQNTVVYSRLAPHGQPAPARHETLDIIHPTLYLQTLYPNGRRALGELLRAVSRRSFGTRGADMQKTLRPKTPALRK